MKSAVWGTYALLWSISGITVCVTTPPTHPSVPHIKRVLITLLNDSDFALDISMFSSWAAFQAQDNQRQRVNFQNSSEALMPRGYRHSSNAWLGALCSAPWQTQVTPTSGQIWSVMGAWTLLNWEYDWETCSLFLLTWVLVRGLSFSSFRYLDHSHWFHQLAEELRDTKS